MSDMRPAIAASSRPVAPGSAATQDRLKRRYRAERRFKWYGIAAISLSALFVFVLIGDIVRKGWPAFYEHRVLLDIALDPQVIDPEGKRDRGVLMQADYQGLLYAALRDAFPQVTARAQRRKLESLLSVGAADDLRRLVVADPTSIGTRIRFAALMSDDADLFLKGVGSDVRISNGIGEIEIRGSGENVELQAATDIFSRELEFLRASRTTPISDPLSLDPATMPSVFVDAEGGLYSVRTMSARQATMASLVQGGATDTRIGNWRIRTYLVPQSNRRVTDQEIAWLETLRARGQVEWGFAWRFFTGGDSREPELAGIRGALIGSALTLLVTLIVCLPLGVAAAVYLEEFAPKNRLTDIIEVNINNLAAVPSIVFGLLGLAVFLNFFGLPRSAPIVGGLVLALLVLPTIIIASRAALKAVPPSIKEAALGVGASHQQAVFHHVLPLAMPGIMTGTIIGMAHALGETAPLLMIGMIAFIVDVPTAITDAATVLPVQIFLWADLPELAFRAKTAAAILVLLLFLLVMNGAAILLRRQFERRW